MESHSICQLVCFVALLCFYLTAPNSLVNQMSLLLHSFILKLQLENKTRSVTYPKQWVEAIVTAPFSIL